MEGIASRCWWRHPRDMQTYVVCLAMLILSPGTASQVYHGKACAATTLGLLPLLEAAKGKWHGGSTKGVGAKPLPLATNIERFLGENVCGLSFTRAWHVVTPR